MNDHLVSISLESLGFSSHFQCAFAPYLAQGLLPGRVAAEHRAGYALLTQLGEISADLAGRVRHEATSRAALPTVGDWVAFRAERSGMNIHSALRAPPPEHGMNIHSAVIHAVLPRRTAFLRAVAGGTTEPQVVAANVDVVVIVCALGGDLNPRRLERYLAVTRSSGAEAVVALTKADVHAPTTRSLSQVRTLAGSSSVVVVSSVTGEGIDTIAALLLGHRTLALVGSSGAGKSTLLNRLANVDAQATAALGVDGRGRHTTTHRELFPLKAGGLVLDTPGMRELRLWDATEGLDATFAEVAAFAARCRFSDCAHDAEPECAVRHAVEDGTLSAERWASFDKLQRELSALARRQDVRIAAEEKRRIKVFSRAARVRDRNRR